MAQSQIKWKRGDYIRLGQAISHFNKIKNELKTEENKLYLPEDIDYISAKEKITTRNELDRYINSLKRFNKQSAELYKTEAGELITKWERKELGIHASIIAKRLNKELKSLNVPLSTGFSRVQMGSLREKELKAQLRNIKQIETKIGYEFERLKSRLQLQGTSDYEMRKAIIYRDNYLKEMEKYSHFDNYDKLMKKLKSIKNPIEFFDFVSKNEITGDLTYQSDQYYNQQEFNRFISLFGIENLEDAQEEIEEIEETEKQYRYLLLVNGQIVSRSNSLQAIKSIALNYKEGGTIVIYDNQTKKII